MQTAYRLDAGSAKMVVLPKISYVTPSISAGRAGVRAKGESDQLDSTDTGWAIGEYRGWRLRAGSGFPAVGLMGLWVLLLIGDWLPGTKRLPIYTLAEQNVKTPERLKRLL